MTRVRKNAFNVREKLTELGRRFGLKGSELAAAETVQEARDLVSAGRKNLAINGGFEVSQRGNYTSATSMVHNTYYLDRWKSDVHTSVTATFNQITTDLPKQYRNLSNTGLRFEATSSSTNAYLGFRQRYEHMLGIDGKYVTVSAWVKSNRTAVLINYDGSGAPYQYGQHTGSGNWEYLSYTTLINYSNDANNYNYFDVFIINPITYGLTPVNSGDYIEITNYQIEIGKNATEFEHRSYGEELALCQRYFYKFRLANQEMIYNEASDATHKWHQFYIGHPMRTDPSVDVTDVTTGGSVGGLGGTFTSLTPQSPGDIPGRISSRVIMSSSGGTARNMYHYDGWNSDYISLSAEL